MTSRSLGLLVVLGSVASVAGTAACAAIAGIELPREKPPDPNAPATLEVPASVVVQTITCGAANALQRRTFSIRNSGQAELTYAVELRQPNATFALVEAAGVVPGGALAPGESRDIEVDAKAVLPGKQSAAIVIKSGVSTFLVPVEVDVRGAVLTTTPSIFDLGELRRNTAGEPLAISFRNDGNESLSVRGTATTPSYSFSASTVLVSAGQTSSVTVSMRPAEASDSDGTLEVPLEVDGPLCGAVPKLSLRGRRVASDVTVGPLTVDLGTGPCGNPSAAQATIKVRNDAVADEAGYVATLTSPNSRFMITGPASGNVPPAAGGITQSAAIVVQAKAGAYLPGPVEEELDVAVTSLSATTSRKVKLRALSQGAVLTAAPLGSSPLVVGQTALFSIKNEGNARTCVKYSVEGAPGFSLVPSGATLGPNDDNVFGVAFVGPAPTAADPVRAKVSVARVECEGSAGLLVNAPLCADVPPALDVSATR